MFPPPLLPQNLIANFDFFFLNSHKWCFVGLIIGNEILPGSFLFECRALLLIINTPCTCTRIKLPYFCSICSMICPLLGIFILTILFSQL